MADPTRQEQLIAALKAFHAKMSLRRLTEGWGPSPAPANPSRNLEEQRQMQQLQQDTK